MTLRSLRISQFPAVLAAGIALVALPPAPTAFAQTAHSIPGQAANAPQSPFAGSVVEDIVVRVNDQIISKSDYDRALQEMETQAKQQGATQQQLEEQKKDLLRDLVDQQLLLSKGKELGITGETELVKQLDAIRKQNHLDSMEALENAAKEQGVSFEDFKQHIRDRIVTQQVIGQEVYRKVNITQGDLQHYYDAHKDQFNKPEAVRLSEILIPSGSNAPSVTGGTTADDPAQIAAAQAKADDIEAKLKAGGNFEDLAKSASAGQTAAQGGDLGEFKRGQLAKVLEDQTFGLKAGEYTSPIRTKQGFIILKVTAHDPGGQSTLKDVMPQVEEAVGAEKTEPALRAYLKQLRLEAYIDYKPGYLDTAAVVNPSKPVYSAYAPPLPKKKKKIERTRFRQKAPSRAPKTETASVPPNVPSLAQAPGAAAASPGPSSTPATAAASGAPETAAPPASTTPAGTGEAASGQVASAGSEDQVQIANPAPAATGSSSAARPAAKKNTQVATTQKPGKKEKIRYGQAPRETLPEVTPTQIVDAGANTGPAPAAGDDTPNAPEAAQGTQVAANGAGDAPDFGSASTAPAEKKTRFSDRAKVPREKKSKVKQPDPFAPPPVTSEEVATQQTQAQPLGLAGDTSKTKKPKPAEKTRLQDKLKQKDAAPADQGAPAESSAPAASPSSNAPAAPPPANSPGSQPQ